jgi:ribosome-binding protein aMBF1 (putative translation factor)
MDDLNQQLREQLERLDANIKQTKSVDEAGRTILHELQQDVQDLLARSGEDSGLQQHPIAERLREGIQHFEVTHPALAGVMEEVVNMLSAMGI